MDLRVSALAASLAAHPVEQVAPSADPLGFSNALGPRLRGHRGLHVAVPYQRRGWWRDQGDVRLVRLGQASRGLSSLGSRWHSVLGEGNYFLQAASLLWAASLLGGGTSRCWRRVGRYARLEPKCCSMAKTAPPAVIPRGVMQTSRS